MLKFLFRHSTNDGVYKYKEDGPLDKIFLILVMLLLVIGTIMMFSASYVSSEYKNKGDAFYFLKRQLIYAALGIVVMFFVSKINLKFYKKIFVVIYIISFILLVVVLFYHSDVNGADDGQFKRWIPVFGITFQPSDIAKIGLIIFLAGLIDNNRKNIENKFIYTIILLGFAAVFAVLVALENHLSGAILMTVIGVTMVYLGGGKQWFFILMIAIAVVVGVYAITNMDFMPDYIQERLRAWLDKDYDPTGARWQTNQSLYAIGSGGFFGLGLGRSRQKHLYLPEPQNDFIFAIVCEELGYFRAILIIALFALLVWRGFVIGMRTKDRFSSLVVMGITVQVGLQTVLNIGVVSDFLPNTGISLPFFSFGGTALILLLAEMGIILSASRQANMKG